MPRRRDVERSRAYFKQRQADGRALMWRHLSGHPCVDCGQADPILLDFDHRDPTTKVKAVSRLVSERRHADVILAEMAKCDVRCVVCHRRRTAKQMGWGLALSAAISTRT